MELQSLQLIRRVSNSRGVLRGGSRLPPCGPCAPDPGAPFPQSCPVPVPSTCWEARHTPPAGRPQARKARPNAVTLGSQRAETAGGNVLEPALDKPGTWHVARAVVRNHGSVRDHRSSHICSSDSALVTRSTGRAWRLGGSGSLGALEKRTRGRKAWGGGVGWTTGLWTPLPASMAKDVLQATECPPALRLPDRS